MERTQVGCQDKSIASEAECTPYVTYPDGSAMWRTWINPAQSKEQCEATVVGRSGCRLIGLEDYLVWLDEDNCTCQGGVIEPAFEWYPGVWVGGQVRRASWTVAEMRPAYTIENSVSFARVDAVSGFTDNILFSAGVTTDVLCENNVVLESLEALVCGCQSQSKSLSFFFPFTIQP